MAELRLVEIRRDDISSLREIGALRARAWAERCPDIGRRGLWLDEFDAVGRHFAICSDRELIAAARVSFHATLTDVPDPEDFRDLAPPPSPIASLNRLVVDPSYRRQGLGIRLLSARLEAAEQACCRSAVTSIWPEENKVRRLERLGFVRCGLTEVYTLLTYGPGAQFMVMLCELPRKNHHLARDET